MTKTNWPDYTTLPADERKPRNEARVMVRVDIAPDTAVICGRLLSHGEHTLLVYKSDIPKLQARTQSEADFEILRLAQTLYKSALAQHARSVSLPVEEAEKTFGKTIQAFYYEAGGDTGLPPIKSLEVGPEVPAPETAEGAAKSNNDTNALLAQALIALTKRLEAIEAQSAPSKK